MRGYNDNQIDAIVLSGGASQMPMIRQRLQERFPSHAIQSERPSYAIAFGAAIYAADGKVQLLTPKTYGVRCRDSASGTKRIRNILFRGTKITQHSDGRYFMARQSGLVPTNSDQTHVNFQVFESDAPNGTMWLDIDSRSEMFEYRIPIEPVEGIETTKRRYTAELRIIAGGILELHVYDDNQGGRKIGVQRHALQSFGGEIFVQ